MEELSLKIEEVSKISRKLIFEIKSEKVQKEMEKSLQRMTQTAVVKGFRKGKVPKELIEKKYAESVKVDVTDRLINESYAYAVKENNLEPVGYPSISSVSLNKGEPFSYEALIEVRPKVEPKGYKDLNLEAFISEPTETDIQALIKSYLESKASMKTIDDNRKVKEGDWVNIDIEGSIDGEIRPDLTAKSYVCHLGDKQSLLEELDSGVRGLKPGEENEVSFKYPEDHHSDVLKGQDVVFKVRVNNLMERVIPELSDELVKEDGSAESKDKFIEQMTQHLRNRKLELRKNDLRAQVVDILLKNNEFDVPQYEVEQRLPELKDRAIKNIFGYQGPGPSKEQVDEMMKQHEPDLRKAAEREVKLWYVLAEIAKIENIKAEENEILHEMEEMAKSINISVDDLKKQYGEASIKHALSFSILERKTFDFIYEHAKIEDKKELTDNKDKE